MKRELQGFGEGRDECGFRQPGDSDHEGVPAREQGDEELFDDMRLSHDSPGDLCLQSGAGLGELLQKLDVSTALSPGLCPCQHPRINLACRGSCPGGLPG